jgi:hypothetical protein
VKALAATQRTFIDALYSQAPCDAGVEVYRRNMLANLGNSLEATFPVVLRLVGEDFFREAARQFIRAHPSHSGDLNEYGEDFAAFLASYPHAQSLPYLPDVARLEWACQESEQAADGTPLDLASLGSVPPESYPRIRFALHPAVRLLQSSHPIEAIWSANQAQRDGTPERDEGPDAVVVSRDEGVVGVKVVDEHEWKFLHALAIGSTLEQASAALDAQSAAQFLAEALARLVREGIIGGFSIDEDAA